MMIIHEGHIKSDKEIKLWKERDHLEDTIDKYRKSLPSSKDPGFIHASIRTLIAQLQKVDQNILALEYD